PEARLLEPHLPEATATKAAAQKRRVGRMDDPHPPRLDLRTDIRRFNDRAGGAPLRSGGRPPARLSDDQRGPPQAGERSVPLRRYRLRGRRGRWITAFKLRSR